MFCLKKNEKSDWLAPCCILKNDAEFRHEWRNFLKFWMTRHSSHNEWRWNFLKFETIGLYSVLIFASFSAKSPQIVIRESMALQFILRVFEIMLVRVLIFEIYTRYFDSLPYNLYGWFLEKIWAWPPGLGENLKNYYTMFPTNRCFVESGVIIKSPSR